MPIYNSEVPDRLVENQEEQKHWEKQSVLRFTQVQKAPMMIWKKVCVWTIAIELYKQPQTKQQIKNT